jgi:hypothetical protein
MSAEAHVVDDQLPVKRATIEELCRHRDRALQLAEQGIRTLLEAEQAAKAAAPTDIYAGFLSRLDGELRGFGYDESSERRLAQIMDKLRAGVDGHAWLDLQKRTGLRNMLDAKGQKEFRDQMGGDNSPPFTIDNTTATFMHAAANLSAIFTRSIVNVFESLPKKKLVTNSAFGFGKRVIWPHAFSGWWGWNHHGDAAALVRDLERVFRVLDGKPPHEAGDFADMIDKTRRDKRGGTPVECENDYLHARCFSTSLHLTLKRADLVRIANDHLTRHYGTTIPDNRKERR